MSSLKKLKGENVVQALSELLQYYYENCKEALTLAEVVSNGLRPDGLTNEIYACFHHMARGLVDEDCDAIKECSEKAITHLKRVALDSHKIVINKILRESEPFLSALDVLSCRSDLAVFVDGGQDTLDSVLLLRNRIQSKYIEARIDENHSRESMFDKYKDATDLAMELKAKVCKIRSQNRIAILMANYREERENKKKSIELAEGATEHAKNAVDEARSSRRISFWMMLFTLFMAIVTAIGVFNSTYKHEPVLPQLQESSQAPLYNVPEP